MLQADVRKCICLAYFREEVVVKCSYELLLTFQLNEVTRMKNMRSFSVLTLLILVSLSSAPVVAMEGPEFDFTGLGNNAGQQYDRVMQGVQAGVEYVKDFYNANAPKVSAAGEKIAESVKNGFSKVLNNSNNAVVLTTLVAAPAPQIVNVPSQAVTPAEIKASFSLKNFFSQATEAVKNRGSQLKEAVQAHPVITGAVVSAVIAVPLVIFGLKKLQKNKKQTVTPAQA